LLIAFSLPFTGWKALSVQTGSMKPAIPPGSLVLVHRVPPDSLRTGDVITYKSKSSAGVTITHRIQQRIGKANGPKQTIVKGDANKTPDAPVYDNQIVGKVSSSTPQLGRGLDFLKTPWGLGLLIYVPIILIFISEVRLLVRRLTKLELDKQKAQLEKTEKAREAAPSVPSKVETPATKPQPVAPSVKKRPKRPLVGGLSVAFALLFGGLLVSPTFASIESEATLDQNVISTIATPPSQPEARLLLERIAFPKPTHYRHHDKWEWRKDPPTITLYATKQWKKLDLRGWSLESGAGTLYTFQGNKWKHLDERTIHIKLKQTQSLTIAGDFLILKNASGSMIDAISWGANTTYLNPSIQGVDPGTLLKRIRHLDTDSAADWRVKH
jgi:signal peptidase